MTADTLPGSKVQHTPSSTVKPCGVWTSRSQADNCTSGSTTSDANSGSPISTSSVAPYDATFSTAGASLLAPIGSPGTTHSHPH